MSNDFTQLEWTPQVEDDCRHLVRLAVREDLDRYYDWTTCSLVPHQAQGAALVVARQPGVAAGLHAARITLEEMAPAVNWQPYVQEGEAISPGQSIARIAGPARDLLTCERIVLNFLGRLCGIATLARAFVERAAGGAEVYDTRKTTPGWRRLEKYAARRGGAKNHRTGLFDAVLIKDNHLALAAELGAQAITPRQAVERARNFIASMSQVGISPNRIAEGMESMPIEVEVDTLDQLRDVLPARPDIVLLDNMSLDQLREAVAIRNEHAPATILEASGGVRLDTVGAIAKTGVDRISSGSITHSAVALDIGLDWEIR